jgi:hypothetical protein
MTRHNQYRMGLCSFQCWYDDMAERRAAIIARRGQCACGKQLHDRRRRWCSDECRARYK